MSSIVQKEIEHFSRDSSRWWDESGPFAPLHALNPVRLNYIKTQICSHFTRDQCSLKSLAKLSILDIGCGGGLVCEPLARLGANVTGLDADETAIETAKAHAQSGGLKIDYRNTELENLKDRYDIVLALEVIEHVQNPGDFVKEVGSRVKPGGIAIFSTLNRTAKSYALGIVAAEYILRWVPQGTHSWKKFVHPSELARHARHAGLQAHDLCGLVFHPLKNEFALSKQDVDVNYLMSFTK